MAYCDLGDVQLFYTDEGSGGPTLLFVHGYTCDSHDWSWQLPFFTLGQRCVAVDLRGHGRSSAPAEGYTQHDLANDLARLIERLDLGPVVVVAHSMGAMVGSVLTVERPDVVRAFVGIDPSYLYPSEVADAFAPAMDLMRAAEPSDVATGLLSGTYTPDSPEWLRTWHRRRIAGTPAHVLRESFLHSFGDAAAFCDAEYLARRKCPVLVLWSDADRAAVEEATLQQVVSKTVAWPGCGHWPHIERPDETNFVIAAWLGEALRDA